MSWNKIVDKIYVITTSDKKERLKEFIEKLPFDHNLLKVHTMVMKEHFETEYFENNDCEEAHRLVAQDAIKNNYQKILVFEDDARLSKKMTPEKINKILLWMENNEWDVFFLGHVSIHPSFLINSFIVRTYGSLECHAICYNRKMMDILVNINYRSKLDSKFDYFEKRNHSKKYYTIDNFFRLECPYIKAYAAKPTMFYQNNFSVDKKKIKEKISLFSNISEEEFDDYTNDIVLSLSYLIILIPVIIFLAIIIKLNY